VELDVRRAADDALAVHHDAVLPGGPAISNLSAGELPKWVPLLDEVFDALADAFVNVEVKNAPNETDWDPTEAAAAAVARLVVERHRQDHTIVSAFNLAAIDMVRSTEPSVPTGWLTLPGYDQLAAVETVLSHGHHAIVPHHAAVTSDLVDSAHGAGLQVITWTVDDPERIRLMAELGVDAVITNVPDIALETLAGLRQ
jgi:glycerophosphoryl diester phosphodiesterase